MYVCVCVVPGYVMCSIAANFPEEPNASQERDLNQFLELLGQFFPCQECAGHFRAMIAANPPDTSSNAAFTMWLCRVHNIVNRRIGNREFECSAEALEARWGSCGCGEGSESSEGGSSSAAEAA